MKKFLFFACVVDTLFASSYIQTPKNNETIISKPTIYWDNFANNEYCVELSVDKFDTTTYSTCTNSNKIIKTNSYKIPASLWSYMKHKKEFYLRVKSTNGQIGDYITLNTDTSNLQNISSSLTSTNTTTTIANTNVDDFFTGFSEQDKLKNSNSGYLNNELLITLKDGYTSLSDSALEYCFVIEKITTALNKVIYRAQVSSDVDIKSALSTLQNLAEIDIVQLNYVHNQQDTTTYENEPQLANIQWGAQSVNAPVVWKNGYSGKGITVAVLDTGIKSDHIDFAGSNKLILGPDFGENDNDPSDTVGHGTHVASIIGANADNQGAIGIAPDATILAIKVFTDAGGTTDSIVVKGIDYAVSSGARVINMSLGTANVFSSLPSVTPFSSLYTQSVQRAIDNGVVVINSAGNDTTNLIGYPRSTSDAIMVNALRSDDMLTPFSSFGGSGSISAPGYFIYGADYTTTDGYVFKSGTSMAAPIVSGAVALLLEKDMSLTPAQVKEKLQNSATDLGASGFDSLFGYGKLNIAKAMGYTTATDLTPPIMTSVEATTSSIKIRFNKAMLADTSANAIDNKSNFGGSASALTTFLQNGTYSYDSATKTLTITSTGTLADATSYTIFINTNVVDTDGINIRGTYNTTTNTTYTKDTANTMQYYVFTTGKSNNIYDEYAHTLATDDGKLIVYYNQPVTSTSAEASANYTLVHYPNGDSSVDKSTFLARTPVVSSETNSRVDDFSGASFSYNSASNSVTISGLTFALGETYGVQLSNIINSDLSNPLKNAIPTIYGLVERASTSSLDVVSVASKSLYGNDTGEYIEVKFNSDVNATEATNIANYTLNINGSSVDLSNAYVLYDSGYKRAFIYNIDFYANNTQSFSVTVNNLHTNTGTLIGSTNSASGTIATGNYTPSINFAIASTNGVEIYFTPTRLMKEDTLIVDNISLSSGGSSVSLNSTDYESIYDTKSNMLKLKKKDNSDFLTLGNSFSITLNTNVATKFSPSFALQNDTASGTVGGVSFAYTKNNLPVISVASSMSVKTNTPNSITYTYTDADSNTVSASIRLQGSHGTASVSGDTITFTPTTDYTGSDSFVVAFDDNNGGVVNNTISVTVADNVNTIPTVTMNSTLTTNEDTENTMTFSTNDADGDTVTPSVKTNGTKGSATISGSTITYTPNANANGSDSVVINFSDGNGGSIDKQVNVTINSVNDTPVVTINATLTTDEDTENTMTFSTSDIDGDTVIPSIKTNGTKGTVSIDGTTIKYTPNANANGTDSFVLNFTDGVENVEKTVTVTINSVNDTPTITLDTTLTTDEDTPKTMTFSASDIDKDTVTPTVKTNGTKGSVSIDGTSIKYTPNANANGSDSFVLNFSDGTANIEKTVTVTINSVNDAPTATINATLITDEDTANTMTFSTNDVDGDTVTPTIKTNGTKGSATISGTTITYTPNTNVNGTDSFVLNFTDGKENVEKTVTVTINSINDVPVISLDTTLTTDEDTSKTMTYSASDVDGDIVAPTLKTDGTKGSVSIDGTSIKYTPNANANGTDSFVMNFTDGIANIEKIVNVTINSINDAPTVTLDSTLTTDEDTPKTMTFSASDVDGDTVTPTVKTDGTKGTVSIDGTSIKYTPNANANGSDSFVMNFSDGKENVEKTVNVTINSINDAPIVTMDTNLTIDEDNKATFNFVASDADSDTITTTIVTNPTNGTATVSGNSIIYTPNENYFGIDTIDVRFSDGIVNVDKNLTVNVNSVNDLPIVTVSDVLSTVKNESASITFTYSDTESLSPSVSLSVLPTNGTATISGDTITYTPNTDYSGNDTMSLSVVDSDGGTTTKIIKITVLSVSTTTDADGNTNIDISFTDEDGNDVVFTTKSEVENITQDVSSTGTVTNTVTLTSTENTLNIQNQIDVNGTVVNTTTITKTDNTTVENKISTSISDTNTTIKSNGDIELVTPQMSLPTGSKVVTKMVSSSDGNINTTATITKSDGTVKEVTFTQYSNANVQIVKQADGKVVIDSTMPLAQNKNIIIK